MHKRTVILALVAVLSLGAAGNAQAIDDEWDPLDPKYTVQRDAGDQAGLFGSWRYLLNLFIGF